MEHIFYTLNNSLAVNILLLAIFWPSPEFHRKKLAVFLIALITGTKILCFGNLLFSVTYNRLLEILFSLVTATVYLLLLRVGVFRILFTYFLVLDYVSIIRGISSFITVYLRKLPPQSWPDVMLCLLLYAATLPPLILLLRRNVSSVYSPWVAPSLWRVIWLLPALNTTIMLVMTNAYNPIDASSPLTLVVRVLFLASLMVTLFLLLRALTNWYHQTTLEQQVEHTHQILELQRSQYVQLQDYMDQTRQARHDLRQHLRLIQAYLDSGDDRALREYVEKYSVSLPPDPGVSYCQNFAVDALMRYYGQKFEAEGVHIKTHLNLPDHLAIVEPDLCVVLGNLLENALEACAGQESPKVRVGADQLPGGAVALIVDNTAPHPPTRVNGVFLSTKHSGPGVGTQSVKAIALHYHGTADLVWEKGVFRASVTLNPLEK